MIKLTKLIVFIITIYPCYLSAQIIIEEPRDSTINETHTIISSRQFLNQNSSGWYGVWYGCGEPEIDKPFIFVEGIDPSLNSTAQEFDEVYLSLRKLYRELMADGFDIIQLDFAKNPQYIERNAMLLVELIEQLQAEMDANGSTHEIVIMGESMGAIITRYALAWMETNNMRHNVKTYISFDGPNQGANVPWGLQHAFIDISGFSLGAVTYTGFFLDFFLNLATDLNPVSYEAAFQLLGSSPLPIAVAHRSQFLLSLNMVNNYPNLCRKIALSNGANDGNTANLTPAGTQLFYFNNIPIGVSLRSYSNPGISIFGIGTRIVHTKYLGGIFPISYHVVPPQIKQWDNAPGGFYDFFHFKQNFITFGIKNLLIEGGVFSFIPLVSALDIQTDDPYFNVKDEISSFQNNFAYTFDNPITPFDAIWCDQLNDCLVLKKVYSLYN
jgi:hypothetical protein